jgi:hypothetical protein
MCPLQNQITLPNKRPGIVLDDLCKHEVQGRQSTNLDGSRLLVTLRDNIKEFPSKEGANTTSLKGLLEI